MNRVAVPFIVSALCSLLGLHAFANGSVQFPVGPATWTVTVEPSKIGQNAPPLGGAQVVKIEVVQGVRFTSSLVTYGIGASRENFTISGTNLLMTEDSKGTAFITPISKRFNIPYVPSAFDWINPTLLQEKGPITYGQKLCFHYKGPQGQAWIDSKTLYPVAVDDGLRLATFTFGPPPQTAVVLPAKFQALLDSYASYMGLPASNSPPGTN